MYYERVFANSISRRKYYFNNGPRYGWPNPLISWEQADKFTGQDIDTLTAFEKWQEQGRLERELLWLEPEAVLFYDMAVYPVRIIYKQAWAMARIRKLKGAAAA